MSNGLIASIYRDLYLRRPLVEEQRRQRRVGGAGLHPREQLVGGLVVSRPGSEVEFDPPVAGLVVGEMTLAERGVVVAAGRLDAGPARRYRIAAPVST